MASVKLVTLYPRTGRAVNAVADNPDSHIVDQPNTIAGTNDASDATFDRAACTLTGVDTEGDIDYYVVYAMDPCNITSEIEFIRFRGRTRMLGGVADFEFVTECIDLQNGLAAIPIITPASGWVAWQYDSPSYKTGGAAGDGLRWTADRINAHKFGFHLGGTYYGATANFDESEFALEVWGPLVRPEWDQASALTQDNAVPR